MSLRRPCFALCVAVLMGLVLAAGCSGPAEPSPSPSVPASSGSSNTTNS